MERIYFYESNKESSIMKILNSDEFMRLSFTTKIATYNEKAGYYIYITENDNMKIIAFEIKACKADLIKIPSTEEENIIITKFKQEAENAASGMGLIFGRLWTDMNIKSYINQIPI